MEPHLQSVLLELKMQTNVMISRPRPLHPPHLNFHQCSAVICPRYRLESLVKVVAYKCKARQRLPASAIRPHAICLCHSAKGETEGEQTFFTRTQTERNQVLASRVLVWAMETRMNAQKGSQNINAAVCAVRRRRQKEEKEKSVFPGPRQAPLYNIHHLFITWQQLMCIHTVVDRGQTRYNCRSHCS